MLLIVCTLPATRWSGLIKMQFHHCRKTNLLGHEMLMRKIESEWPYTSTTRSATVGGNKKRYTPHSCR